MWEVCIKIKRKIIKTVDVKIIAKVTTKVKIDWHITKYIISFLFKKVS